MKAFFDKYGSAIIRLIATGILLLLIAGVVTVLQDMSSNSLSNAMQHLDDILKIVGLVVIALLVIGWYLDHQALRQELQQKASTEQEDKKQAWRNQYLRSLSVELIGTVITVVIVCAVVLVFQQYRDIENDKTSLSRQMASPDNDFALEAVRIARLQGWLQDGSFAGIGLGSSNLENAHLGEANLTGASFLYANLNGASLWSADLSFSNLAFADLSQVNAKHINLSGANLDNTTMANADLLSANLADVSLQNATITQTILAAADFTGADLSNATLRSNNFDGTNLTGANLMSAELDNNYFNNTVLPDQTIGNADTDLTRFTDTTHPEYERTLITINRLRNERGFKPIEP